MDLASNEQNWQAMPNFAQQCFPPKSIWQQEKQDKKKENDGLD